MESNREERTQFTFYESFFKALARIKRDADRGKAYDIVCDYALYGKVPDLDKMPDAVAIAFELIKPTLDASRRKASSGKRGGERKQNGSKAEANRKQEQTASEKEKEIEKEKESENECCYPCSPLYDIATGKVFASYLDRVNPNASQTSLDELKAFVETCGADVCLRAIDIAVDERKTSWSYIRAILQDKASKGIASLADWDKAEQERQAAKPTKKGSKNTGSEDLAWMREYL